MSEREIDKKNLRESEHMAGDASLRGSADGIGKQVLPLALKRINRFPVSQVEIPIHEHIASEVRFETRPHSLDVRMFGELLGETFSVLQTDGPQKLTGTMVPDRPRVKRPSESELAAAMSHVYLLKKSSAP
jgi:hypothetical protein